MSAGNHRPRPIAVLLLLPIVLGCGQAPPAGMVVGSGAAPITPPTSVAAPTVSSAEFTRPDGSGASKSAALASLKAPAKVAPSAVPPIKLPDDVSLPAEEYLRLGLPAWDRQWSAEDMTRAADILAPGAPKLGPPLPRFESKRSGTVFARLTAPDNFAMLQDPSVPPKARMILHSNFNEAFNRILMRYGVEFDKDIVSDRDMIEMFCVQLHACVMVCRLVDDSMPTFRETDRDFAARVENLKVSRQGLALVVSASLQILTERRFYGAEPRRSLVVRLQSTLPTLLRNLSNVSRTEMRTRLDRMNEDPVFRDLQPELGELCRIANDPALVGQSIWKIAP